MFLMVIRIFKVENKKKQLFFFKKIFLLPKLSLDVILEMSFITLRNIKINFLKLKIFLKTYALIKIIPITKKVQLVGKKKFTVVAFYPKKKKLMLYK